MDITAPVENFFTDLAPAPLPTPPKPLPRKTPSSSQQHFKKENNYQPTSRPKAPPVVKSIYNSSELDGNPRLIRHGSATFPSSLSRKGITSGTIVLEVELSTSGSVKIRRVVSATHQDLVSAARRVASGARFTAPKKNGKAVKAIMRWPIVIQK